MKKVVVITVFAVSLALLFLDLWWVSLLLTGVGVWFCCAGAFAPQDSVSEVGCLVLGYIAVHYAEGDLTIEKTSDHVGLPVSMMENLLAEELHTTFEKQLRHVRCAEANRLFAKGLRVEADVAMGAGFSSVDEMRDELEAEQLSL